MSKITDTDRLYRAGRLLDQVRLELWSVQPPAVPEFRQFYDEALQSQVNLARLLISLESIYPYTSGRPTLLDRPGG